MQAANAVESSRTGKMRPGYDRLLRFDPDTEAIYEAEDGPSRARFLSVIIAMGLLFYNCFNATSVFTMPDILWESIFVRTVIFTGPTLTLCYLVLKLGAVWRERIVLVGMMGAFAVPVALFWWTRAPLGNFTFTELALTLVYGSLVLSLRFRYNLIFVSFALSIMLLAVWTKPGLQEGLGWALTLQSLTMCAFAVVSNYLIERRRCRTFLYVLQARSRAQTAEQVTAEVERLALTDTLSGLPNRRALDLELNARFDQPSDVAVLMTDIDHFKLLNDTLGHAEGDRCLQALGAMLADVAKTHDVFAARYGGEEFAVIMSGRTPTEITRIADDILRRVKQANLLHPSRPDALGIVTLSIGAALRPAGQQMRIGDLMQEADAALYAAKAKGRDRCVVSDDIIRQILSSSVSP